MQFHPPSLGNSEPFWDCKATKVFPYNPYIDHWWGEAVVCASFTCRFHPSSCFLHSRFVGTCLTFPSNAPNIRRAGAQRPNGERTFKKSFHLCFPVCLPARYLHRIGSGSTCTHALDLPCKKGTGQETRTRARRPLRNGMVINCSEATAARSVGRELGTIGKESSRSVRLKIELTHNGKFPIARFRGQCVVVHFNHLPRFAR